MLSSQSGSHAWLNTWVESNNRGAATSEKPTVVRKYLDFKQLKICARIDISYMFASVVFTGYCKTQFSHHRF